MRPIPWFLTEEVEVLVDPSTWTDLNKVEPGTNDRDYLSSLIVLQSYVRILLFVRHDFKNAAQMNTRRKVFTHDMYEYPYPWKIHFKDSINVSEDLPEKLGNSE